MRLMTMKSTTVMTTIAVVLVGAAASVADAAKHKAHVQHPAAHRHPHAQAYQRKLRTAHVIHIQIGGKGSEGDPGDDYPAVYRNRPQDAVVDQWGEYSRECTSFVAWALASRNGFVMPFYANARDWGTFARRRGFTVDSNPAPGAVAWSTRGTFGHVAYVQDVSGGNVHIEEYNHDGRGHYSSRVVPAWYFTGYIHFRDRPADVPPLPPAPAPTVTPAPPSTPAPTPTPASTPTPAPTPGPTSTPPPVAPPQPPPPPPTWRETVGGNANTWTNYTNAGGTQGPTIPAYTAVQIACKLPGFRVADGNTWWYRIASSPWNNQFYVSADAFYNNGRTSGSLVGTPFVDDSVANC